MLSHVGYGSRKDVKALVRAGRVHINGNAVTDAGVHVDVTADRVEVDGALVVYREYVYVLMNKPQGVVSATEDAHDETVVDLLEPELQLFDPFPVGRLDKDTEGLLLLTNDGQLAHRLLSPKHHVDKTYYAEVEGAVTEADVRMFAEGVTLEDGYHTLPARLDILSSGPRSRVEVTIVEGKYHQVRRMFAAVGKHVAFLQRIRMGLLGLDDAIRKPGMYRELTEAEILALHEIGRRPS